MVGINKISEVEEGDWILNRGERIESFLHI